MGKIRVLLSDKGKWKDAIDQGAVAFVIDDTSHDIKFYDKDDNEVCLKKDKSELSP